MESVMSFVRLFLITIEANNTRFSATAQQFDDIRVTSQLKHYIQLFE